MRLVDTGSVTLIQHGQALGTDSRERGCQTSIERQGTQGRVNCDDKEGGMGQEGTRPLPTGSPPELWGGGSLPEDPASPSLQLQA